MTEDTYLDSLMIVLGVYRGTVTCWYFTLTELSARLQYLCTVALLFYAFVRLYFACPYLLLLSVSTRLHATRLYFTVRRHA